MNYLKKILLVGIVSMASIGLAYSQTPTPMPSTAQEWYEWFDSRPVIATVKRQANGWSWSERAGGVGRSATAGGKFMIKLVGPPWSSGTEAVRSVWQEALYDAHFRGETCIGLNQIGVLYGVSDSPDIGNGPPDWVTWTEGLQ